MTRSSETVPNGKYVAAGRCVPGRGFPSGLALGGRSYGLTEVRILDLLILSAEAAD